MSTKVGGVPNLLWPWDFVQPEIQKERLETPFKEDFFVISCELQSAPNLYFSQVLETSPVPNPKGWKKWSQQNWNNKLKPNWSPFQISRSQNGSPNIGFRYLSDIFFADYLFKSVPFPISFVKVQPHAELAMNKISIERAPSRWMGPRARAKRASNWRPFWRARADPFTPRTSFKGRCVRNRAQKRKSRAWLKEHLLRFEIIVHQIHQLRQSKHDKPIPTIPKWWSWSRSHLLHFNFSWRSPLKRSIVRASCLQVAQVRTYVWSSSVSSPEFSSAAREKASAMLKSCWK